MASLDAAVAGCLSGEFAAMVTAPVQKSVINDAGISFTGHTEFLAQRTGAASVVMLLVGAAPWGSLRVALATTHLPLAAVPAAITRETLTQTLRIVVADLERSSASRTPRLAVCGLNPHAGEGGYLGREEIDVIAPVLDGAARGRPRSRRTAARRHGVRSGEGARLRLHRRDVPRPGAAGAQARELRPRRQRDPGPADRAHFGRPRHRARPRRRRRARARAPIQARYSRRWTWRSTSRRGRERRGAGNSPASPAQALRPAFPGRSALRRAHRRRRSRRNASERIVEIGPGLGALTRPLLAARRPPDGHRDRSRSRRRRSARRISSGAPRAARRRCADVRFRGARRRPARHRQPALQHLVAAAVSPRAIRCAAARRHRDAAKGGRAAHGRGAGDSRIRPPVGDAAGPLSRRAAVCRAGRRVPAAAQSRVGGGAADAARRGAPGARRRRPVRASWSPRRSASGARHCAMR